MLSKLLSALFQIALHHRRTVFMAFGVLVVLALIASTNIRISTSQSALLTQSHPVQQEYRAFVEEFGAVDALVAVIHGDDPTLLKPVADELAGRMETETEWVKNVFHKVDVSAFAHKALYFASEDQLDRAEKSLQSPLAREVVRQLDAPFSTRKTLDFLAAQLGSDEAASSGNSQIGLDVAGEALDGLHLGLETWREFLSEEKDLNVPLKDPLSLALDRSVAQDDRSKSGGYLTSRDGRMVFVFIQPKNASDESSHLKPFLARMAAVSDEILADHPELLDKVAIGFTGSPAHVHTEATTVFQDVARGILGAVILLIVIVFVGFRTVRKTVCLFVPLLCGMAISLGVITLTMGHLNLISAAFFAVMFGMGMDFGIYLVRRTEEELGRGESLVRAVEIAVTKTGRGVFVGGMTTCVAFWGTSLTEFAGFSELGIAAGIGIFICLTTVFFLTPSMMLAVGVEPRLAETKGWEIRLQQPGAKRVLKIMALSLCILAIVCMGSLYRTHFDYDALKLLPKDSESTSLQRRMQDESDLAANSAVVVVGNLDEARTVAAKLRQSPEVSRVETLSDVIPEAQMAKSARLKRLDEQLAQQSKRYGSAKGEAVHRGDSETERKSDLLASMDAFSQTVEALQEQAFSAGSSQLVASLDQVLTDLDKVAKLLRQLPDAEALRRTHHFESQVDDALDRSLARLRELLASSPLNESDVPSGLLGRFKSERGNYVVYAFPASSVWDVDALDRFMGALRSVSPRVTGFAATHQVFSRMVPKGFVQSMVFALLGLVIMLAFDLRSIRAVAFALTPVALGLILLQGILEILGIDHNYASVAAYPVLLGYGSDYGVNVVHRWLERPQSTAFVATLTAGKGVLLSAVTSIAGLCSIVFARHKGVSDFGAVLLSGVVVCLVTAVLFLPVFIDLFKPARLSRMEGSSSREN